MLNNETFWLRDELLEAYPEIRARHIARWQGHLCRLAVALRRAKAIQTLPFCDQRSGDAGIVIAAAGVRLPANVLDELTAFATDDLSAADVIRALLARQMTDAAPAGWDRDRGAVGFPLPEFALDDPSELSSGELFNTHCPAPYEWVPDALAYWCGKQGLSRTAGVLALLEAGLGTTSDIEVLRTVATKGAPRVPRVARFASHGDLDLTLNRRVVQTHTAHLRGAAEAAAGLLEGISRVSVALAHRTRSEVYGDGIYVIIAGDLDRARLQEATRRVTSVGRPALVRAVLAQQLAAKGLAPAAWDYATWPATLVRPPVVRVVE